MSVNTGQKVYATLTQIDSDTGIPTGTTKSNDPTDPDYIPPAYDPTTCPPPTPPSNSNNRILVQFVNQIGQTIVLAPAKCKGQSLPDDSQDYVNDSTLSLPPNSTISVPVTAQLDIITRLIYTISILSQGIPVNMKITYKQATDTSATIVVPTIAIGNTGVNYNNYFPTPTESGTGINILQIIFTAGTIPVGPTPPTVSAGSDQLITLPTSSLSIMGSAAATTSGATITTIAWTQTTGPVTAVIASPNTLGTAISGLIIAGTYGFNLTVTDSNGLTAQDNMQVVVNPEPISNNGTVLIYVENLDGNSITDITLRPNPYQHGDPLTPIISATITNADGVVTKTPVKGTYDFAITVTGVGSLKVDWGNGTSEIWINVPESGVYVIDGTIVDSDINGVIINFKATNTDEPTYPLVYAKLTIDGSTTENDEPTLPDGLTKTTNGNITVAFFSDSAGTTPVGYNGLLNYNAHSVDSVLSTTDDVFYQDAVNAESMIIADTRRIIVYDYTVGSDPINDIAITYTLLAGQGYLIIT